MTVDLPRETQTYADAIFDVVRESLLILNSDLQVVNANRAFYQTFHLDAAACQGQILYDLGDGEWNQPRLRELLEDRLPRQERVDDFEVIHTLAARRTTLLINARRLQTDETQPHLILLAIEDVTHRVQGELLLRQSQDRFRLISEMSSDYAYAAILRSDGSLHTEWVTGAVGPITGYTAEEIIRRGIEALIHPYDRRAWRRRLDTLPAGESMKNEVRIRTKDGQTRWLLDTVRAAGETEHGLRIVGAAQDITERKEAVETLRQRNEEMEQFVYTVSHDLKSPLVTITGFIGMLESYQAAGRQDKVQHAIRRILRSADRMSQLIDELLELSRIGRAKGDPTEVNVTGLLHQLAESLSQRIRDAGCRLSIQPNMPRIWADEKRLTEVFENLLANAIKYGCTEPGAQIEVSAELTENEVHYMVADQGPGIEPAYHKKIFGLFQRLDPNTEGTGVGLAIVAKIMQVHGGRVWVESAPDEGARFILAFPRASLVEE